MPYFRRYQGRRRQRYRRKSRFLGNAGKALALAGTAVSIARGVKSLMNIEYKRHMVKAVNSVVMDTTGSVVGLSLIGQGDDRGDRNGRSIKAVKFDTNYNIVQNVDGGDRQSWRMIIFQDMHQDGTIPAYADLLLNVGGDITAFRNPDDTDRFKVLMDRSGFVSAELPTRCGHFHKKLNSKLEYIGTSNSQAAQGAGNLYLLFFSGTATNGPVLALRSVVRYIDN